MTDKQKKEEIKQVVTNLGNIEFTVEDELKFCKEVLKRKEQECERLKHDNGYEVGALERTINNLKAENDELENELNNLEEQKTLENNFIDSLLNATKNSEWLNKSILEDEAEAIIEKVESDYVQLEKYKQALQEIIKIAEPYQKEIKKICGNCNNYDDCHACCKFDLNCYQYKKGDTTACEKFIVSWEYDKHELANKILQKCEVIKE